MAQAEGASDVRAACQRQLRPDQRCAMLEILGAILRPDLMLPVMRCHGVDVLQSLSPRRRVAGGGSCQCAVEVIFGFLEMRRRGPQQPLRLRYGVHGRRIVAGDIARLQFADPVVAFQELVGWVTREALLERLHAAASVPYWYASPSGPIALS